MYFFLSKVENLKSTTQIFEVSLIYIINKPDNFILNSFNNI